MNAKLIGLNAGVTPMQTKGAERTWCRITYGLELNSNAAPRSWSIGFITGVASQPGSYFESIAYRRNANHFHYRDKQFRLGCCMADLEFDRNFSDGAFFSIYKRKTAGARKMDCGRDHRTGVATFFPL
jgi:hypothetical protein